MEKNYDAIIIGTGQSGPALAARLPSADLTHSGTRFHVRSCYQRPKALLERTRIATHAELLPSVSPFPHSGPSPRSGQRRLWVELRRTRWQIVGQLSRINRFSSLRPLKIDPRPAPVGQEETLDLDNNRVLNVR